jgi:outer membrane receptor for ferrienterochelin and colicins
MNPITLGVLVLLSQNDPAAAAESKPPLPVLKEVLVVTGSRTEELQTDSAIKVEALTRKQMLETGYERLSDALAEVPGVMTRRGSTATVGGQQIQGIDSRQVLVLQDGLPMVGARGIKGGVINLNRQSLGRLEQVEVAKGAGSALYGTDAIGGVINMITRDPTEKLQGGVSLSGGSLGMIDGRYDLGGIVAKRLTLFGTAEHHRMDSYGLIANSPTTVGPEWRRFDGLFKARYQFNDTFALGFRANGYDNRERGRNFSETGLVEGLSNDSIQTYAAIADWIPTARTVFQARAYAARYDENSTTTSLAAPAPAAYANLNQRFHRLDATGSQQINSWNLLQGGVEWAQDAYKGTNRVLGDDVWQQVTFTDVWLQDRMTWKRATVTLGGRYHKHSMFGAAAVPKVGLVYRVTNNWVLRGSFGKGFRAPDLGQLYFRFANPASFYQVIGNPNLEPEVGASWSTGVMYRASRMRVGVSLFRNGVRNLIDTRNVGFPRTEAQLNALLEQYGIPPVFNPLLNRQTFLYFNVGRIYTQGFEVDGEIALTSRWRARWAYTFLDAIDEQTGLRLAQRHRHHGFTGLDYVNARWGVVANVRGTFFSNWLLNPALGTRGYGYGIWDCYASKDLPRGVQLFGTIDNIGDSRDRKLAFANPSFDRPDFGRMYRLGMRWNFQRKE